MGLTISDFLKMKISDGIVVLGGRKGLRNEIKGVTIIEAPDIVRFIDGGELLLTGLYAFRGCSTQEFSEYLHELRAKKISGLIVKRGREVQNAEEKHAMLLEFADECGIPLMELPFEVSFQVILSEVMQKLFNEEVIRLKYYKTTHDNFSALALSGHFGESHLSDILDILDKLIENPVALYHQNMTCYASSRSKQSFMLSEKAEPYNPGIFSNYQYLCQKDEKTRYIVQLGLNVGSKMYLVITEQDSRFSVMDCIAVESAIVALQYEFAHQFAVTELEKKFQNDVLLNLLEGTVVSSEEIRRSALLLGMKPDVSCRVVVIGMEHEGKNGKNINERIQNVDVLENAVRHAFHGDNVHRNVDKLIIIQTIDAQATPSELRRQLQETIRQVQATVVKDNRQLRVKAGVGRIINDLQWLPDSYKEAEDAYLFVDVAGELNGESQIMLFSDLGIFKLLTQMDDSDQLMEYIPESLQKLLAYKRPQRDDLLITLKTYLDRNQNLSKTAQDLYVHYKTAAYRIDKIAGITGIDFSNANEILAVQIGLVVYRIIENKRRKQ